MSDMAFHSSLFNDKGGEHVKERFKNHLHCCDMASCSY